MDKHPLRQRFITLSALLLPLAAREELGFIRVRDGEGNDTIKIQGVTGDIELASGDCVELFPVAPQTNWNPEP